MKRLILILLFCATAQAQDYRSYKPNYFSVDPTNGIAKFQISFASKLLSLPSVAPDFWISYTGRSLWDLQAQSEPFKETSHSPELFMAWGDREPRKDILPCEFKIGYLHQSNGLPDPTSRAWDRAFGELTFKSSLVDGYISSIYFRAWHVLRVEQRSNPDIEDYAGNGSVVIKNESPYGTYSLEVIVAQKQPIGYCATIVEVSRKVPAKWMGFEIYCQLYSGYAEELIEYKTYTNSLYVGIRI